MKNIKKALIIGVTGQDGAYLSNYLLDQGYEIYGTARRGASEKFTRLEYLGIKDKVNLVDFDILELSNIQSTINEIDPSEIYNLAAQSFVPTSFRLPILTTDINSMGVIRLLDSIVKSNKQIKCFKTRIRFCKSISWRSTRQMGNTPIRNGLSFLCRKIFSSNTITSIL